MTELFDRFMVNVSANFKETTHDRNRQIMKHLKPFFSDRLAVDIKRPDVIAYKEKRFQERRPDGKPLSADTVRKELSLLRQVFAYADDLGIISDNPVRKVIKKLPKEVKRNRTLKTGEAERLALALPLWLRPIVVVALQSGLRRTNTVHLRKEWIKWDTCQIIIPVEYHKAGRRTGKPYIVTMNSTVREELRRAVSLSKSEYVFTLDDRRTPFNLYAVSVAFKRAAVKAGLKDLRFHDLRREFGTTVAKLTGSFVAAQEALNVTPQTARIYIQTTSEDAFKAFEAIEANGAGAVLSQIYHNETKKRDTDSVTL